uniref:asparagine synthase (glutamine-hydrolyzing) n=1 Tax=Flavobacterium sp. TaxID=239 RepID=UPI0040497561
MCGIVGFIAKNQLLNFRQVLDDMGNSIAHRGPDSAGIWFDENHGIGFSHRRLSIVDVSASGHQPMFSKSERYVLIYNGEIYNHSELRKKIEKKTGAFKWSGHSDTETLLESIEVFGIDQTLRFLVGMFAIAIWDAHERKLTLVRDRAGEKPLYYGWQNGVFLFGSELKAICKYPEFEKKIDQNALKSFFKYNYIPAPYSIYQSVKKVIPGTIITLSVDDMQISENKYWDFKSVITTDRRRSFADFGTAVDELEKLIIRSVKGQMMSDVPLGAFLSGGVDSSTVVGVMQSLSHLPIKTFTIGFEETNFNEATYAKEIASHLKTDHTELYVSSETAQSVIPMLPLIYDEPFSDSSQIPTYLVAKLAKQKVTVSLSGDAGDELFTGYNRYLFAQQSWNNISRLPNGMRNIFTGLMQSQTPAAWDSLFSLFTHLMPSRYHYKNIGDKIHKLSYLLRSDSSNELYDRLITHWSDDDGLVLDPTAVSLKYEFSMFGSLEFIESMMAVDTITYLPDDILVKVDRASMANSLETRVPFLDHRIIEFAWSLPMELKLKGNTGKHVLREVLYKYVPKELIERPKMGFGVPIDSWLRGPLREWAEDLLDERRLHDDGLLNVQLVQKRWKEHLSGKRNWQYHLWDILMFQSWYKQNK